MIYKKLCLSAVISIGIQSYAFSDGLDYKMFCGHLEYVSPTLGPTNRLNPRYIDNPHMHCYNSPGNGVHLTYAPKQRKKYIHGSNFYIDLYNDALSKADSFPTVREYLTSSYTLAQSEHFRFHQHSPSELISHFDLSDHPLLSAIEKGDMGTVRNLLDQGVNPNEHYEEVAEDGTVSSVSALAIAILNLDDEMVELLISEGAIINGYSRVLSKPGDSMVIRSPIGLASEYGLVSIVNTLLYHGSNPNSLQYTTNGLSEFYIETPLDLATKQERREVKTLLEEVGGAEFNLSDVGTPILYPGNETARVGDGMSYLSGQATLESAIDRAALDVREVDAAHVEDHDDTIIKRSQYIKLISDTAKVTGSGIGWIVSDSNKFLERQEFNEKNLAFSVRYMATLKRLEAKNTPYNPIRLTEEALNFLIDNGGKDFLDTYGTHFVTSINLGGSFLGQYNLSFASSNKKTEFVNEFSGSWTNGRQAIGFSNELKRETQEFQGKVSLNSSWISFGANPGSPGTRPSTDPSPDDGNGLYSMKADFINTLDLNAARNPELLHKQALTTYPWSSLYQIKMLAKGKVVVFTENGWEEIRSGVVVDGIDLLTTPSAVVVQSIAEEMQALLKLEADVKGFIEQGEFAVQKDRGDLNILLREIQTAKFDIIHLPYKEITQLTPATFAPYQKSGYLQGLAEPYMNGLTPIWVAFQQNNPTFDPAAAELRNFSLARNQRVTAIEQKEIGHSKTFGVDVWTDNTGVWLNVDLRHTRTQKNKLDWNRVYTTPHALFLDGKVVGLPSSGLIYSNVHGGFAWAWAGRPEVGPFLQSSVTYQKMSYGFNGCPISYGAFHYDVSEADMVDVASEDSADGFIFHPMLSRGAVLTEPYDRSCQSPANESWPLYLTVQ